MLDAFALDSSYDSASSPFHERGCPATALSAWIQACSERKLSFVAMYYLMHCQKNGRLSCGQVSSLDFRVYVVYVVYFVYGVCVFFLRRIMLFCLLRVVFYGFTLCTLFLCLGCLGCSGV